MKVSFGRFQVRWMILPPAAEMEFRPIELRYESLTFVTRVGKQNAAVPGGTTALTAQCAAGGFVRLVGLLWVQPELLS